MFSVTTPKRLRSRTSEFSDLLRLTPHSGDRPPVPASTARPSTPETAEKPKRRLGFLSRKKTFGSLSGAAAVASAVPPLPAPSVQRPLEVVPSHSHASSATTLAFRGLALPQSSTLSTPNSSTSLPPLNISPSLSPIMHEFTAATPQPSPIKPRSPAVPLDAKFHNPPSVSRVTPLNRATVDHTSLSMTSTVPQSTMASGSQGTSASVLPTDKISLSSCSLTSSSFETAESGPCSDEADCSADDQPLSVVAQNLAMQFPLPPLSPTTIEHSPLSSVHEAAQPSSRTKDSAKRTRKLSISVVEELKRVLGTDIELESGSDGEHGSPCLAYDVDVESERREELMVEAVPGPPLSSWLAQSRRQAIKPQPEGSTSDKRGAHDRRPPTIPLPPPPSRARTAASKRHAVSIQLPVKPRASHSRSRSGTAISLPSEDKRTPGTGIVASTRRPRTPSRKISLAFPSQSRSPQDAGNVHPSRPASFYSCSDSQLRAAFEHQRVQLESVTRELKTTRAAHEAERAALLHRIDVLERETRRRERENEAFRGIIKQHTGEEVILPMSLKSFAAHLRADSAASVGSQYSVESIGAVAREFSGFLTAKPVIVDRRASVLGVPEERRSPNPDTYDNRRNSSPVILGGHFPPLSEVLSAADPLTALVEADASVTVIPSSSLPSLSSSSTISSALSSIAESPVLPVETQDSVEHYARKKPVAPLHLQDMVTVKRINDRDDVSLVWSVET